MNSDELCKWLRQNSSGIYRPAADAADEIERLQAENAALRAALAVQPEPTDPMNWKLPRDVMEMLRKAAFGDPPTPEQVAHNLAVLQGIAVQPEPAQPPDLERVECENCGAYFHCERCGCSTPEVVYATYSAPQAVQASEPVAWPTRTDAEKWYVANAFDYATAPIGSRDWVLFLQGWAGAVQFMRQAHEDACTQCSAGERPVARTLDDWNEEDGQVVWWKFPIEEAGWIGSPLGSDWPGYHTHWTPHPALPKEPSVVPAGTCRKIGGCECAPEAQSGCVSWRAAPQPAAAVLRDALVNYMAAFGQALESHGIPFGPQQIEADAAARVAVFGDSTEPKK